MFTFGVLSKAPKCDCTSTYWICLSIFQYSFDNKTENFDDMPARFGFRLPSDGLKVSIIGVKGRFYAGLNCFRANLTTELIYNRTTVVVQEKKSGNIVVTVYKGCVHPPPPHSTNL